MTRGFNWNRPAQSNPWNVSKHEPTPEEIRKAAERRRQAKRATASEKQAVKRKRKWKRWKRKAHQRKRGQPEITQCVFGVADDSGPRLIAASKVKHVDAPETT